jgi:hypothetical protein
MIPAGIHRLQAFGPERVVNRGVSLSAQQDFNFFSDFLFICADGTVSSRDKSMYHNLDG